MKKRKKKSSVPVGFEKKKGSKKDRKNQKSTSGFFDPEGSHNGVHDIRGGMGQPVKGGVRKGGRKFATRGGRKTKEKSCCCKGITGTSDRKIGYGRVLNATSESEKLRRKNSGGGGGIFK